MKHYPFFLSFLVWPLPPTHCRYRALLLHFITLADTYTLGRTPLDDGSARRRDPYLHNTQHSQEREIHAPGGIETAISESERPHTYVLDHVYSTTIYNETGSQMTRNSSHILKKTRTQKPNNFCLYRNLHTSTTDDWVSLHAKWI